MVDDTNDYCFYSSRDINLACTEFRGCAVYLYSLLMFNQMKRFIRKIKKLAQKLANFLVRVITFIFYFIFITPFGIFVRLFKDYLDIKREPSWQIHKETSNIDDFLKRQ